MTFRKPFHFFAAALVMTLGMLAWSCSPEEIEKSSDPESEETDMYPSRPVTVTIGNETKGDTFPETKSAVTIDDSHVSNAAVFFFKRSTGKILVGNDGPYVFLVNSNSFACDLPYDPNGTLDVDIYTICNYSSLPEISSNLKESDLDGMVYTISSISELQTMPMAGVTPYAITPNTNSITLGVDRLFAIYYVNFDLSAVRAAGYTIDALYLTTHSVNRSVHWFRPSGGDRATSTTALDYASGTELRAMADGASAYVYVTENMQGSIGGASNWRTVQKDLGSKVAYCTYIDLGVKVKDGDNRWTNVYYQIYLGNGDMKSQFDIPRNYQKSITVKLPADGIDPQTDNPAFSWDTKEITLYPGNSYPVDFSYQNIDRSDLHIFSDTQSVTVSNISASNGSGSILVTARRNISTNTTAWIFGGDADENTRDLLVAHVVIPSYELAWETGSLTFTPGETKYARFRFSYPFIGPDDVSVVSNNSAVTITDLSYNTYEDTALGFVTLKASPSATGTIQSTVTASYNVDGHSGSDDLSFTVNGGDEIRYEYEYEMTPENPEIYVGDNLTFTIKEYVYTYINDVLQQGVTVNTLNNSSFTWSSNHTNIASVSRGTVTGVAAGSATITAVDGNKNLSQTVTVVEAPHYVDRWEISPESETLQNGQTVTFTITQYEDLYIGDVLETEDTQGTVIPNSRFNWSSSSNSIATVSSSGVATAVADGTATITATWMDVTLEATVIVSNEWTYEHVYRLDPNPMDLVLVNSPTGTFTVYMTTKTYVNGNLYSTSDEEEMSNSQFSWNSSSTSVATVYRGNVTAVAEGATTVTATRFGESAEATVNVSAKPVVVTYEYEYELVVAPDEVTLAEGESMSFTATYYTYKYRLEDDQRVGDPTVTTDDVTDVAVWSVVSGSQYVTNSGATYSWAGGPGTAYARATFGGVSGEAEISTEAHVPVPGTEYDYSLEVSPNAVSLEEDDGSVSFTATYTVYEYQTEDGVRVGQPTVTSSEVTDSAVWSIVSGGQYVSSEGEGVFAWVSGPGTATIKATYDGQDDTAVITTGGHNPVESFEDEFELVVSPTSVTIAEGETASFTATYIKTTYRLLDNVRTGESTVTETDVTSSADWTITSGSAFVTNDDDGEFTWKNGPGSANIKAEYNNTSDTATVNTEAHNPVESFEDEFELVVSPSSVTIAEGETASFTATYIKTTYRLLDNVRTGEYTETETDVTSYASWTIVSGSTYVTNDGDGEYTWKNGSGSATIRAAYNNTSDTATVNTEAHVPVIEYRYEYEIDPEDSEINVGGTEGYTIIERTYTIIDGVEQPGYESETLSNSLFSWSSSNNSVATVSNGNATGRDSGKVTITASATRHGENVSLEAVLTVYHIFEFTGETSYDIHPGQTINVPYSTTLPPNDVESWENGPIESRVESGYVVVTCQTTASGGDSGTVHGGNTDKGATDAVGFTVVQTESFEDEFELVVSPSSATIAEGETASFTATYIKTTYRLLDNVRTGEYTETETDVTSSASWTIVSGSTYVTNDGDGEYTWKNGPGNSTIKATYGGKSDTAEIETLEYVEVTYNLTVHANSNTTVVVGESISLTAILTEYHNGSVSSTTDVTSICNWEADASEISVSEGVVTASERVVSSKVTATYNVGGTDYSDFVEVTFIGYEYIYLSHDLSYTSSTEKVGGTFSASINVPAEVNVEATLYGGNFLGGILGYLGGVIEYDDCYSGYVEVEVSGEPTSIAITSAYFVGGSSEFYDEEEAIIYVLSF